MKRLITISILILGITFMMQAQEQLNPLYDAALAKQLGADDFGMKSYFFVLLKTGPTVIENKSIRDSLFAGHLQNINRLANQGKLIVAGPLGKNKQQYRGLYILNCETLTEADSLLQTDPAIAAKLLDVEIFNWYGSAALPSYLDVHQRIEKKKPGN